MSVNLTIRSGTTRAYPEDGDTDYAAEATNWAQDATNAINNSPTLGDYFDIDLTVGSAADVTAGTADHSTIEDAITAASAGNVIKLLDGTYSQASILDISKAVTIIGHGEGTVIDSAAGIAAGAIAKISTSGVRLMNLKIDDGSGAPDYALEIEAGAERTEVNVAVEGTYAISTILNSADNVSIVSDGAIKVTGHGDASILLKDNSATALQIGSAGATDLIKVDTTNGSEKVTINGDLDVTGAIDLDTVALNDSDDSHDLSMVWDEDDSSDRTLNLKVNSGDRTLDLSENLTIGDGYDVDITAEDAASSVTLDNVDFEVENTNVTQRTIKIKAGTDADATISVEGTGSEINQDVTDDADATFNSLTTTAGVTVGGDLTVNGTTVTIDTDNLNVEDKNITVNNGGNDASSEGAGLTVERTGADGSIVYEDALTSKFKLGAVGSEVEIADVSSTQTFSNKTHTSPVINTGVSGTAVDTDGTLAANSDTKLASQKATKAYVDTEISAISATGANYEAKVADYVVTDIDNVRTIGMTTGATDRTVTLPTAADNDNRIITVKKIDSGAGSVTVEGEAAGETIDGVSGTTGIELTAQYAELTVQCDGSVWHIITGAEATADRPGLAKKNVDSGTFTSTASSLTNLATATPAQGRWSRIGNVVTYSFSMVLQPAATSINTSVVVDLPETTANFSSANQGNGMGAMPEAAGTSPSLWPMDANNGAQTATIVNRNPISTIGRTTYFVFVYEVQ